MTTTATQLDLPGQHAVADGPLDMTGMYVMHHAFRRDLDRFVAAVRGTPAVNRETWRALAERWDRFGMVLHHHHEVEDDALWPPLLREVDADGDADGRATLVAMAAEHDEIDPLLESVGAGFRALAEGHATAAEDEDARSRLELHVVAARESLGTHLAHEEGDALPLAQRLLPDAEWQAMEVQARKAYSPRELLFLIPWAAAGLSDADRERGFRAAGLPFKILHLLTRPGFERSESRAFAYA
jgi:hemerythrin-like domain-containing protein